MSAVLSPCGWAWLVCSRRLLVWCYRNVKYQFRELTLPPSDLAHRAQLVVVYAASEGQVSFFFFFFFFFFVADSLKAIIFRLDIIRTLCKSI